MKISIRVSFHSNTPDSPTLYEESRILGRLVLEPPAKPRVAFGERSSLGAGNASYVRQAASAFARALSIAL